MTSGNLFFKLLIQDFRKRIWCPICIFILDFLMLEVVFLLKLKTFSGIRRHTNILYLTIYQTFSLQITA